VRGLPHAFRLAHATLREPREAAERARELFAARRERTPEAGEYTPVPDWHENLHELLGLPWPCSTDADFARVCAETRASMDARGLTVSRGSFGGWDDAGPEFTRAVFCVAKHLQPRAVVETGVAHGVTTRAILMGLAGGSGRLWSIDLPPLVDERWRKEIGAAVPQAERAAWTYVGGSSRRRLPALLDELGTIGLFVHDSLHTERNMYFELRTAWDALDHPGVIVADDVHRNRAFGIFLEETRADGFVAADDDGQGLFGVVVNCRSADGSFPDAIRGYDAGYEQRETVRRP
jgi:predicted O-methyltransferase YrrM